MCLRMSPRGCLVEEAASDSRYTEEANIVIYGYLLQHSYLENPMDKGACQAEVHRIVESDTSAHTHA